MENNEDIKHIIENDLEFNVALKTIPQEGNLVYEYNPFYNYRLDEDMYFYKNQFFKLEELQSEFGISPNGNRWVGVPSTETPPIFYQKGLLVDFVTDELLFDLNHPVNISPSYSYDNSVDLVINDGKNLPRLINSRFSATERNLYIVNDREGNNDTNIYDRGDQFDIDTSLYKKITTIPKLELLNIGYGGNLSVGNYNFYFKYVDDDGNESDFFAESSLILIFIGSDAIAIHSGFRNENSHKTVSFLLSNLDKAYLKIKIYYTIATSDIYLNMSVNAYSINEPYYIKDTNVKLTITGYETTTEISIEELNEFNLRYSAIETQAICLNILFFGHNYKVKLHYLDLKDIALRFLPSYDTSVVYKPLDYNYSGSILDTYYNPVFTYNKTGYWSDIYRFGIVFIYSDYTLSDVYNVRGTGDLTREFTKIDFWKDKEETIRNYISYDERNYLIVLDSDASTSDVYLENVKGVVKFPNNVDLNSILGISFSVDKEVIDYLKDKLGVVGFFFVRLKRIPTILCLAYTIGIDRESNLPVLPINDKICNAETFLNKDRILDHSLNSRLYELNEASIRKLGAICPEYDVNSPYLNSLFTGESFVVEPYDGEYYAGGSEELKKTSFSVPEGTFYNTKIIGLEDNVKLVSIGDTKFSARAGEAEEGFRFAYLGKKEKNTDAINLARGSYGPYLGMVGYDVMGKLVNIRIPHYNEGEMENYFKIRYEDPYPYYSISERYDINTIEFDKKNYEEYFVTDPLYRGDCFICNYTHRLNRNFLDPSAPANDEIVDPKCWKDNFKVEDDVVKIENFEKINLGDLNAVKMGRYINLIIKSNINLNIRAIDDSIPDEASLFGHPRTFSPYIFEPIDGPYKTPEALCYNKAFEKSLSERCYYGLPNVPFLNEDFTNRISYSNIKVTNSFLNGHRTFKGSHYRDYSKEYGSIIKLEEWQGNLICVCEHGTLLISVNERAVAAEGALGFAYINTSNVLPENPYVISDKYGSLWRESIIKTPHYVYGVDTVARKIWRTNGLKMDYISDHRITEFLNNNISLTERELTPIIGVRNVKSHYNEFKGDVMFTFYDNLHGFEEKVWNICFNEKLDKWITFYSWVPSYSENIYNSLFSFDRNTSKWIAKLGTSLKGNAFSDGIVLEENIIKDDLFSTKLDLVNRTLPEDADNIITYTLERDNYGNYKKFKIENNKLIFTGDYKSITSEFYQRDSNGKILKDDRGRRIWLDRDKLKNPDKVVLLLNIRAHITANTDNIPQDLKDAYNGLTNTLSVDAGYYLSVVAVIPEYNMLFLTTDFWRHGLGGIIDISDKIYPTYWYGKQHPFEFEFVVADNPGNHKIFDNLLIISNKAEPESFHYEIVGECYEFAKDKKNMYIRQEATKELYQYNGSDITFNPNYKLLDNVPREVGLGGHSTLYDKSTIFPLYYSRKDTINEIEDAYHLITEAGKDFSYLAGAEIVRYENLDEYRIWNHAKAVDINLGEGNILRGNMYYKEDVWDVLINPLNMVLRNEKKTDWLGPYGATKPLVPAEYNLFPIPEDIRNKGLQKGITLPDDWKRNVILWPNISKINKESKMKDKFIKIRIRYSGKDLAIISAIKTLYSISYA